MQEGLKQVSPQKPVYVIRKRSPWPWIIAGILFLVLVLFLLGSLALNVAFFRGEGDTKIAPAPRVRLSEYLVEGEGKSKIAIIPLEGFIGFSGGGGLWERENIVEQITAALEKAGKDEEVKAVILRINSPGGGITAADMLNQQVKDFQATGKKVVSLLGDVAASGAYYVACQSDLIVAHPTTLTGSFGVIIQTFNLEGLMEKLGIGDVTIKSGEQKDLLSPFRPLSPEEREMLEEVVEEMHSRFVKVIVEGRNLEKGFVERIADGSVFTASRALSLKLIDEIGFQKDAVRLARELAGLEEARVVEYRIVKSFWDLLRSQSRRLFPRSHPFEFRELFQPSSPRLLYLWSM